MNKLSRKTFSIVMSIALVVGLCPGLAYAGQDVDDAAVTGELAPATSVDLSPQIEMTAQAVVSEKEPNNSFDQANLVNIGDTVNGKYNVSGKEDYYRVILPYSGPVKITFANDKYFTSTFGCDFYLRIYNQHYEEKGMLWTSTRYTSPKTTTVQLQAGVNYLKFVHDTWTNSPADGHPYHFKLAYDASGMDVSLSQKSFTYDGKAKEPRVVVRFGSKTLTAGTDYTVTYSNNVNPGIASATIVGKGAYEGEVSASYSIAAASLTMHRLYNPNSGEHFYTSSAAERDNVVKAGWKYEGVGWTAPSRSNTPVYRLYNANGGEHHYTTNKAERDNLVRLGWKDEGIGWYSDDAKAAVLHRLYNPNAFANNHHYTTSESERDWLVSLGWKYEGVGWYGA